MRRWEKHGPYLHVLAKGSPKQRQGIIHGASKELITCLCEGALNTLNGNIPLKPYQKTKLSKHRKQLRTLANRRGSLQSKRNVLLQKGGSKLAALLPPLLGILGSIIFKSR